jgi:hypothetical protein
MDIKLLQKLNQNYYVIHSSFCQNNVPRAGFFHYMDGAAFGCFVRKLQNISKRFSNPDGSSPGASVRGALKTKTRPKAWLRFYMLRLFDSIRTFYMHNDSKVMVPDLRKDGMLMFS